MISRLTVGCLGPAITAPANLAAPAILVRAIHVFMGECIALLLGQHGCRRR